MYMRKGLKVVALILSLFCFNSLVWAADSCPNILDMGQKFTFHNVAGQEYPDIAPVTFSPRSAPHFKLPDGPIVSGRHFVGWFTDYGKQVTNENAGSVKGLSIYNGACHIGYEPVQLFARYENANCTSEVKDYQTFKFNFNGGTLNGNSEATHLYRLSDANKKIEVTPSKIGYRFDGWYKDADLKTKVNEYYMGTKTDECGKLITITLYAKWVEESSSHICPPFNNGGSFELLFETNGGNKLDSLNVCVGCDLSGQKLPIPAKPGYEFLGWYKDQDLTLFLDSDDVSAVNASLKYDEYTCPVGYNPITLYAGWKDANGDGNSYPSGGDNTGNNGNTGTDPKNPDTGEGIRKVILTCSLLGASAVCSFIEFKKYRKIRKI